jgi:hypothetical protein
MSTEFRLLKLERGVRRRPPPSLASGFDPARLTMREHYELDQLLAQYEPGLGRRQALAALTDEQLERMTSLTRKAEGVEPDPPYRSMPHREPGSGPCWCVDCLATAGDGQVGP